MPPTAPGWPPAPLGTSFPVALLLMQRCFPIPELHLLNILSNAQPEIAGVWLSPLQESSGEEQQWDATAIMLPWSCWISCWQKGQAREFVFADMTHHLKFWGGIRNVSVGPRATGVLSQLRPNTALAGLGCVSKHPQARRCLKHPSRRKSNQFCELFSRSCSLPGYAVLLDCSDVVGKRKSEPP